MVKLAEWHAIARPLMGPVLMSCAPGSCRRTARADLRAGSRFQIWDRAAAGSWIPGSGSAKYGIVLTEKGNRSQGGTDSTASCTFADESSI